MIQNGQTTRATISYGCERLGRLSSVLLHRPGKALEQIDAGNVRRMLFNKVPDIAAYIEDHDRYRQLLLDCDVNVLELGDYVTENRELMDSMVNLTFLHDTAVISRHGAILSKMAFPGRCNEHLVVREALENLGIPLLFEFTEDEDCFEGCLLVSHNLLLVAETERHTTTAIMKFIAHMRSLFKEIIYVDVPKQRRFMHPDTIFNRVKNKLALAYLPAFKKSYLFNGHKAEPIDFQEYMTQRGFDIIAVSDDEQQRLACSFVPLDDGVMVHYDTALDRNTMRKLAAKGVELVLFHPHSLHEGGGSLRCHTLRLKRE